jgi:protein SCO1/2
MASKAVLVMVAILSWLATAAITVTVLTVGPITRPGGGAEVALVGNETDAARADEPLPRYGIVPVFNLTDQLGRPFGLNDLRGKVWVCDTIFTRCTAICPTLTSGLKQIQGALKLDQDVFEQVYLVSLSLDGGHDTPEVLKTFAGAYKADPERWRFLTGEREVIWPLVQDGLKLPVEAGGPDIGTSILHSGKLLLIDRTGVIRGYYDGLTDAGRIELLVDLRRLLAEE